MIHEYVIFSFRDTIRFTTAITRIIQYKLQLIMIRV